METTVSDSVIDTSGQVLELLLSNIKKNTGAVLAGDVKQVLSLLTKAVNHYEDGAQLEDAIFCYLGSAIAS